VTQVVDASAVVAALTDNGDEARWCEDRLIEHALAAPHLMPFEVANIVRRLVGRRALDQTAGADAIEALTRLRVSLIPFEALSDRVWQLRDNLTSYDASYVAAAELLGCRLVTLDRGLAAAPGTTCEIMVAP